MCVLRKKKRKRRGGGQADSMDSAEGPLIEGIHTQRMKERKMGKRKRERGDIN